MNTHEKTTNNKLILEEAELCCCIYCKQYFNSCDIIKWIDGGETALCPKCSVDSVIPAVDTDYLNCLNNYWFGEY